jgi:hypothetical protein
MPAGVDFKTFIYPGAGIHVRAVHGHFLGGLYCLGPGVRVSAFPGIVILAPARPAGAGVQPDWRSATVIGELLLLSFTLTAFGVMMAARITQIQAFMALTQMLVMPLFLSGALHPLRSLPAWLTVLTRGTSGRFPSVSRLASSRRRAPRCPGWRSWSSRAPSRRTAAKWSWRHYVSSGGRGDIMSHGNEQKVADIKGRRRVATGANHPASLSSAFRRGPGTPAAVPRRGTRAPI